MSRDYNFRKIEGKWQKIWADRQAYRCENSSARPKYYVLDMFPYPSGAGLHIGHPEGYTASDIVSRYYLARGYNVLHPMGWDAFGLPAEQHAIQTGISPAINTAQNVDSFRRQIQRLGYAIDWSREINTTDPTYYRWTQWIFLQLFKHGLAYVEERPVWWCPALKTVLANEEVVAGRSERGGHPVERRQLRQWVLRITAYGERLIRNLDRLDWPDSTKNQQLAWIGRSSGAEVDFCLDDGSDRIRVFTTRPETLFGVTYLALAPEHPLLERLIDPSRRQALEEYRRAAAAKSDLDRTDLAKTKTGLFTGSFARHPLTDRPIPIWVADYVLMGHGQGAVMGVPGHDLRDFEFAQALDLPIMTVIASGREGALPVTGPGELVNSGEFTGLDSEIGRRKMLERLEEMGQGRPAISYRLRDWLFSRQRYWGEPMPIFWVRSEDFTAFQHSIFADGLPEEPIFYEADGETFYAIPLTPKHLPLELPTMESFAPSENGESPLAKNFAWVNILVNPTTGDIRPSPVDFRGARGKDGPDGFYFARRETNTMPQWAGSCWYYLRYMSPHYGDGPVDPEAEKYWQGPDLYIGGAEHAVLHLLYARFWHEFLNSIGQVTTEEPFQRLFHQGIILGEDGNKMSKSRGNVISPDQIIDAYGADALRLYEMFLGPLDAMKPWSTAGIEGICRFLKKIWRWIVDERGERSAILIDDWTDDMETQRVLHEAIRKIRADIESLHFNTAISQLMILLNHLQRQEKVSLKTAKIFVQLFAPFAPHVAEELWQILGEKDLIHRTAFPDFDEQKLQQSMTTLVIQVNGRRRGEMRVPLAATEEEVIGAAKLHSAVEPLLAEREIIKEIYVRSKVINFVVR